MTKDKPEALFVWRFQKRFSTQRYKLMSSLLYSYHNTVFVNETDANR